MTFLYFLEHTGALTPEVLAPIEDRIGPLSQFRQRHCAAGPGEKPGYVAACSGTDAIGYYPDRQSWTRLFGHETIWLGYDTQRPPGPADLLRPVAERLPSHPVALEDGRSWEVPIARQWTEFQGEGLVVPGVPCLARRDRATGRWEMGEPHRQYRALWEIAERYENLCLEQQGVPYDQACTDAVTVLGYHYRIGPDEAEALEILSYESAQRILSAVIDLPTRIAWIQSKKKDAAPDGESISPGDGG
jgi:hypothetical protein